ncbi:MAG: hypothetical protein KDB21_04450 [Acidimicrobiales bacterium]|nr:hypothetical protein [Acidimicrobiales bacterium]
MTTTLGGPMAETTSLRAVAGRLIEVLDECGDDVVSREADLADALRAVLALPGLDTVVANPVGDADGAEPFTGWLYHDGDLRIVRGRMPAGMRLDPHSHGTWNLFGVYSGAVKYVSYRRLDDGTEPYRADLEVAEDRIMRDGDVTVMPGPPHDIHGVVGLAPVSTTVLVARGQFSPVREQFFPDEGCYVRFEGDGRGARVT